MKLNREALKRMIESEPEEPSGCPGCFAIAGCCSSYPNCPGNPDFKQEIVMTKRVRVENADTSSFKVVVQVWDKGYPEGAPDVLAKEIPLDYPCAMTGEDVYLTSSRYLVVKEVAA